MSFVRALLALALAALVFPRPAAAAAASSGGKVATRHMIAAANPFAAAAGLEMLRAGGSAVDAAIAAQMVLTLVEPESSGIGGGAFLLLYDPAQNRVTSFDGRETAPASATPGMFLDASGKPRAHMDAIPGGLSVGVPGTLAMLEMAHRKYGRLPWAKLFQPAIRLAEKGFPVSRKMAVELREFPQMAAMPDIKRYLYTKSGEPVAQGDIIRNRELAKTLRLIARGGAKAFYSGAIAQAIVDKVNHAPVNPAHMTLADLASYRPAERSPVCGTYRVYRLCSMAPPSSGGIAVLQILKLLERFSPDELKPQSLSEAHLFTQASRLAFADRAEYLGDPDFIRIPVDGLIDSGYLKQRSLLIDPAKDMGTAPFGVPPPKHAALEFAPQRTPQLPGTSHLSVVDDRGLAVSMTTTIEFVFGSEMMTKGFFLNNELTDFSFEPAHDGKPVANAPAPGKRPLSAMAPTIVFGPDGKFLIAAGSPGGPMIIEYVANALIGMLDGGLSPQDAAALAHVANPNAVTILEKGTAAESFAGPLTAMGHSVRIAPLESGLHIIEKTKAGLVGGADPRRDGVALGD